MNKNEWSNLKYMTGFGNEFASEESSHPNSLPIGQNSPQKSPYNLYQELISGTAFTAPRESNRRSWLYRILPSVKHSPYKQINSNLFSNKWEISEPNQIRWLPFDLPKTEKVNFVQGIATLCGAGDPRLRHGMAIHIYN
ncbi:unnamed protein product, partial [Brachionus calyciflorus]